MRFDRESSSQETLLNALDRQIALVGKTTSETLLDGMLLGLDGAGLEQAISAASNHYDRQIAPSLSPTELASGAIDKLESAKKLWETLQSRTRLLLDRKATIARESETLLRLSPQLKNATQELSQMMDARRVSRQTTLDAKKQIDLVERFAFIASAYLADGGAARYDELVKAIDAYSQTLYSFSNEDHLQASVLALVANNQMFWQSYQESLNKVVENRKQTIEEIGDLYRDTDLFGERLREAKTEIVAANGVFLSLLRGLQIALALATASAIGYAACLFMPFHKESLIAKAPQNQRGKELFDDPNSLLPANVATDAQRIGRL
jgi:hypothetical protein